ncbi:glycosyltransferase family 2 protein [Methylobacter tundripaludum]|uniref:glycosyltransferase family 2 protein n=1 Tax=Methylobacter tundripaludum TaxID=173365 RepID=UPI0004DFB599|nr:glycosyltransferase family 2 protein [Methylobacter tundripaludum]
MRKKISVVIPVYQNAGSIEITCREVAAVLREQHSNVEYEFVMVNDGSTDASWEILQRLHAEEPNRFKLINLTRNFGQLSALLAGYNQAEGDCIVSMAADMQDPPQVIADMVSAWFVGHKLVIANRIGRSDGFLNDVISNFSWGILKRYALPTLPKGGFDVFLMDRVIRNYYIDNPEQHIFMQGRLLYYGEKPFVIPYKRKKRIYGKSQTSLGKKIKYLIDGFTGYSFMPLRIISIAGIMLFFLSIVAALVITWYVYTNGSKVEGWASLMVMMLFLNGMQLLAFGVIGEYLWRNIEETRKRPHYIISEKMDAQRDD